MQTPHRRLWPQILLSLALTALATGIVLRLTWQDRSWRALQSFDARWLVIAFGLVFAAWLFDMWRLQVMGRGIGYRISARVALRTNLLGYFLSAITPFTVGGGPLQIYSLYRAGLPAGHAAAIVMGSGFIAHLSLALMGLLLVFGLGLTVSADEGINNIIRWLLLIYTVGLMILTLMLLNVGRGRRLLGGLVRGVLRIFGSRDKVEARAAAVEAAAVEMGQALRRVTGHHLGWVLVAAGLYQLYFLAWFSTVPALAVGLGARPPYWHVVSVQVPIYLLGSIIPTPGGSGGLELGMAGGLLGHVPDYDIGLIVAGWRFLTYYFVVAAGGLVLAFFVRGTVGKAPTPVADGVAPLADGGASIHGASPANRSLSAGVPRAMADVSSPAHAPGPLADGS
ncbi:MAG TPA: lysylphosphatidylglycerol synthase transmembrane domain-containing protein [Limnochordales bacterium]